MFTMTMTLHSAIAARNIHANRKGWRGDAYRHVHKEDTRIWQARCIVLRNTRLRVVRLGPTVMRKTRIQLRQCFFSPYAAASKKKRKVMS